MPKSSRSSFPVSTVEWIASLYMAALPVSSAAPNLQIAIATLPAIAAMMTRSEPECSATIAPPLRRPCYHYGLDVVGGRSWGRRLCADFVEEVCDEYDAASIIASCCVAPPLLTLDLVLASG